MDLDFERNNAYPTVLANNPLLPLLLLSLARQKNAPKTSPTFKTEYDYIIVGAGAAGSVVASRLSEIPCVSVLLLEAGPSPPLITEVPALAKGFYFTDLDWNYKTVPQTHSGFGLVDNQVIWQGGKALGGSSIINGMQYVRGNKNNYDDWAREGAVGWSASDTRPYFLKLEDNRDPEYLANGYHVVGGPISVHTPLYSAEMKKPILEAAKQMGYEFVDSNGATQTGFHVHQGTLRNSQRCSTAKAYLVPAENRTNLDILTNALVTKVLIKTHRATGVRFEYESATFTVRAKKEVIVSAGTINTAQLLMLSGIGPRDHLLDLYIPVNADLPVGNNLQDHCAVPVSFVVDPPIPPFDQKVRDPRNIQEYIESRTGPLASTEGVSLMAFLNKKSLSTYDFPDFQIYFDEFPLFVPRTQYGLKPEVYRQVYGPYENSTLYVCVTQLLQPKSRGTVRLQSINPRDPPLIDANYLADPEDIRHMVEGIKKCLKIGNSGPMQKIGSKPLATIVPGCESFTNDEDAYLECFARSIIITNHHSVGTAKMGDPYDPTTVVDSQLRVKGIKSLRVVDASIMPIVPSANTYIPTVMVAEKASDMIKTTINCYTQTPFVSQNEFPSSTYFQKPPFTPWVKS